LTLLEQKGQEPPTIKELADASGATEKIVRDHLALLVRDGQVFRVSADIYYHATHLETIRASLTACLQQMGEIVPSEFRDLTGLSRKFMIPLLEFFDNEKLTIRVGDKRILRKR